MGSIQMSGSDHVLHYGRGVSGNVFADVGRNSPGIGIVTSPGRRGYDYKNGLALVKLFTHSCTRSTDTKEKPKDKFKEA
jgi:hypothetical protein